MLEVRPFIRSDRDGLASLANRHIAAVLPGGAVPIASLLSHLERDSHEPIVDPWVVDRHTVVGVNRDRLVAAAHLKRYGTDERVGDSYRNLGEIDWLVFDPREHAAGRAVLDAAIAHLGSWRVSRVGADGNLPCLGVYGIPDSWQRAIPNATLIVIPACGHLANLEQPDEFNRAVREFCRRHRTPGD